MISTIVSRLVILVFGTLYPAYASYKAVRTKNVKEYVKWMMYWIVFALFTCAETFTDVFLSWFPFYYEIKIILVLWLLSPATKGSSILYRKFVHPMLSRREQEIDEYISKAKDQGYHTVLNLGTKGVNYATTVIMQTAIKGGGGIVNQLRKSYSLSDLTQDADARVDARGLQDSADEASDVIDARLVRRRHSPRRSASGSSRVEMYFPEVDIRPSGPLSHVRSTEDVSSGYSSAEPLYVGQPPKLEAREALGLVRTASVGGSSRPRIRSTRASVTTKKVALPEDSECSEESDSDSEPSTSTVKYIPKQSLRSVTNHDTDSSDNNFEDTIGFPVDQKSGKVKTIKTAHPLVIQKVETNVCNVQIIEVSQTPQKIETYEFGEIELAQVERKVDDHVETICNVQLQIRKESIDIFEDSVEGNLKDEIIKNLDDKSDLQSIVEPIYEDIELNLARQKNNDTKLTDYETISLSSISQRGGKYNKHVAPIPPSHIKTFSEDINNPEIKTCISFVSVDEETSSEMHKIETDSTEKLYSIAQKHKLEVSSSGKLKMENDILDVDKECVASGKLIINENQDVDDQECVSYEKSKMKDDSAMFDDMPEIINVQKDEIPRLQVSDISSFEPEILNVSSCEKDNLHIVDQNLKTVSSEKLENITSSMDKLNKLEQELVKSDSESLPIKATLVLKPGVIKSLGCSEDANKTEVFVSHSPKSKQKLKSKHESPISRLMMLPKKFFGHKEHGHSSTENLNTDKRKSWHEDTRCSTPVSNYSKSDTEGSREQLNKDASQTDSKLVLRTLSHSPKQYRRKAKDLEQYEDSD